MHSRIGIVEAVDVVPTLLECAGVPIPGDVQGASFAGLLRDEPGFAGKEAALMESTGWKNLRTDRFRYLCEASGSEGLYDLERDPMQYENVAGRPEYEEALHEHRRLMMVRTLQIEKPLRRVWPY